MKAIRFERYGGYDELRMAEVPDPEPADGEVLVRMTAAAVNPLDNTVRLGYFPMAAEPPLILGTEGVGVVEQPGASGLAEGTRVMFRGTYGVTRDGTWREYVAVGPGEVVPVPDGLTDAEAAAVPVAYLTAQLALKAGGFSLGQSVLAPGVGGSVGVNGHEDLPTGGQVFSPLTDTGIPHWWPSNLPATGRPEAPPPSRRWPR